MKLGVIFLIGCFFLSACGGAFRVADPVSSYEYGDENKSCRILQYDLERCKEKYDELVDQRNGKIAANAVLGVTGALLFFPLLFVIDASDVDMIEINAQQKRYASLTKICKDKNCDFEIEELPEINSMTESHPARTEPN